MSQAFLFYFFAAVAVLSALGVVFHPRPARALLCLVVTMFALAVHFTLLGAYFVAMAHLIVYAGAVLVLFLFVIMLQGAGAREIALHQRFNIIYLFPAGLVSLLLAGGLIALIRGGAFRALQMVEGTAENIGTLLFNQYLLPFEWTSLLILLGVFAAIALAKKDAA